jgi:hypothetical protein
MFQLSNIALQPAVGINSSDTHRKKPPTSMSAMQQVPELAASTAHALNDLTMIHVNPERPNLF